MKWIIPLLACYCLNGVVVHSSTTSGRTTFSVPRNPQFKIKTSTDLLALKSNFLSIRGGATGTSSRKKKRRPRKSEYPTIATTVVDATATCDVATTTNDDSCSEANKYDNTYQENTGDLPTIKAILIPRRISIPQLIRFITAFLFTSSMLESIRTSGTPYADAVKSTLESHGVHTRLHTHGNSIVKINALDEFFAKKICQGENSLLPPKYFPSTLPLVGLMLSMFFHFGINTLFPKWFIEFNAWMNFDRIEVNLDSSYLSRTNASTETRNKLHVIESLLKEDVDVISRHEPYEQSQFTNKNQAPLAKNPLSKSTGLAVLVQLSKRQREMASDGKYMDIYWLYRSEGEHHPQPYFIEVGQRRVYVELQLCRSKEGIVKISCQDGGPSFYKEEKLSALIERGASGLSNREDLNYATIRYGTYNDLSLPIPTIHDAFVSRLSSPLAVLQLVGRVLTALEEAFFPALMNILMTLGQHYMNAKRSIVSAKELSSEIQGNVEDAREQMFWTLRPKRLTGKKAKWLEIPSSQILPGDVFYLPSGDSMMPVDALILEGTCIAQEAVITGESVPQAKTAIEPDDSSQNSSHLLSMDLQHRNSMLFAGTTVMHCENVGEEWISSGTPQQVRMSSSVKCLALKSGSYSSKGEIISALSKSSGHTGSISTIQSERDSLRLIVALSSFAVVACASLFVPSKAGASTKTSGFRRFIQCTRIAVASIPSDLPLALNNVVHCCSQVLRKEADVVCSEPGSLLSASQIDMIVFDKTGTLSADTQKMTQVVTLSSPSDAQDSFSAVVLAGCHSLSSMKGSSTKLIGDPLDLVSLEYSNWAFNSTDKSARVMRSHQTEQNKTEDKIYSMSNAKKLWQIKTFPFDPTKRRSSALLLVQNKDNEYLLWKVVKGAPDCMRPLLSAGTNKPDFFGAYDDMIEDLGSKGMRIVTLAVQDVTESPTTVALFPRGLPTGKPGKKVLKYIAKARKASHYLHIGDFEESLTASMTFAGFACFDASIRPSTPRVINDIRGSGTDVCMLTGDGTAAALSVARQANFFDNKKGIKVAILKVQDNKLVWSLTRLESGLALELAFNTQTTDEVLAEQERAECAIMITGNAMENILELEKNEEQIVAKMMLNNLDKVAVISRSTPQIKQQVLSALKSRCGRKVMMCGDGVNDISAMKTADISAALLNGFGTEEISTESGSVDIENERRKAKLKHRKIGFDRHAADFGTEGHCRIRRKLEAAAEQGKDNPQHYVDAILNVFKEEYKRAKEIKKGGATAARILQEEDSLRKSLIARSPTPSDATEKIEEQSDSQNDMVAIKPGESSIAAQFTFLRPCIDGAEAIVRSGVAAAAFSLSSHRSIALNSLMACYNLASLYRDGFRYGKYMWNVELTFIMAMDQGQSEVSSRPRSRIPRIRPHESIFHVTTATSVLLQSIIHLFLLSKGVKGAKLMESYSNRYTDGLRVRFSDMLLQGMDMPVSEGGNERNVLGRVPFRENLVTNVVFLLSIFQNVMISSINHSGVLFHGSLLESKSFCVWASISILFCTSIALEVQPSINRMLQLAPMSSKVFQTFLISLFFLDAVFAFVADRLCIFFLDRQQWVALRAVKNKEPIEGSEYAADIEENLLNDVRKKNLIMVRRITMLSLLLIIRALTPQSRNTLINN